MAVLAEPEQGDVEQRTRRIQAVCPVEILQHRLVSPRRIRERAFGRYRMDVLTRDRCDRQQRLLDHAEIAVGMIRRDEALVAPEPMHVAPGKGGHDRRHGENWFWGDERS